MKGMIPNQNNNNEQKSKSKTRKKTCMEKKKMKSNKTICKWITLSPEHRDTNDIGRSAFKINIVWFAANKPTMGTYFIKWI